MSHPAAHRRPSPRPGESPPLSLAAREAAPVRLYTMAEAAAMLRVPEGWLRKKVTAGVVPHTRLGKHVRFTTDELRRIVVAAHVEPAAAPVVVGQGLSPRARRRPVAATPTPPP